MTAAHHDRGVAHNLSRRSTADEWMDIEPLDTHELQRCLKQLAQINLLSLGYRPTLSWLAAAARRNQGRRLSLLDVGYGYGDMLRRIRHWADRRGIALDLHGLDINPVTREVALAATPASCEIHYHTGDIFALPGERRYDLIVSSLFAHHLGDVALLRFLRWMQAHAMVGWFINDLERSALAYFGVKQFLTVMGYHRVVRHDGPVSVERALTLDEWRDMLDDAGLHGRTTVRRFFPFRIGVGALP